MTRFEPEQSVTLRSTVSEVISALREVPEVAKAFASFATVALSEGPQLDSGLKKGACAALNAFVATIQRTLQLEERNNFEPGSKPTELIGFNAEAVLRDHCGFVPQLLQAQKEWPELVAAEARLLEVIVFEERALSRADKERLLLVSAVGNDDAYCMALHFGMLRLLGEEAAGVRILRNAASGEDPIERLTWATSGSGSDGEASQRFEEAVAYGFNREQCLEALTVCAAANLLHSLQVSLAASPDFPLPSLSEKVLYPGASESRPTAEQPVRDDPDAEIVARVKSGDTEAYADLIRPHTRRVFATLLGLLADAEEARDVSQEAFLKAFENLHRFEGRSKFSSWLMSIAINTGTEVLRKRRHFEPIDSGEDDDEWRPRQIQEWSDNPEECFAKEEMKDLVRRGVMRLPNKYRLALLVRDVSQLSTEDAADALGLSVPALKARVLRGRLMLREALAPHFATARERGAHG